MSKSYLSNIEEFNTLPQEIKDKVISIMGAYSEVNVTYEFGRWDVGTCSCLRKHYAPDHKCWFFDKEEIKKQYSKEIEKEEKEYEEQCENCNWDAWL